MSVVVVSPCVPYPGIGHAGGEFLLRYLSVLANGSSVSVIAPHSPDNEKGKAWCDKYGIEVLLLMPPSNQVVLRHSNAADVLWKAWKGSAFAPWFHWRMRRDARVAEIVGGAATVDLQWPESGHFVNLMRRLAPESFIIVSPLDILTQRWKRAASTSEDLSGRAFYAARYLTARRFEKRVFRDADLCLVLSDKDQALLRKRSPGAAVRVVLPDLSDRDAPLTLKEASELVNARSCASPQRVLFVGAFSRPENAEAAAWFLREVWPTVIKEMPRLHLTLAGSGPPDWLLAEAKRAQSVRVTGYLESLSDVYRESSVAIVPLRRGAGVKFKTVQAMFWALPIVATTVGAEGVDGSEDLFRIVDDSDGFAAAVVSAIVDESKSSSSAIDAWRTAGRSYSASQFQANLTAIFLETGVRRGVRAAAYE